MKWWLLLALVGGAGWSEPFPFDKGDGPTWDAGTPIESAFGRCRNCHDKDSTPEPTLYMPFDGWVSSMMANAQRDPLFHAAVAVANQDIPGIGQWCHRCHSPQAYLRGHVLPADGGALDRLDREGVTCDVCHRSIIPADQPDAPFVGNAQMYFDLTLNKYGPYPNGVNSAHNENQSDFTGSSQLCGQCHSVHNPLVPWRALDGGILGNRFPLDTTYEEWKQSSFARLPRDAGFASCVDCHMPRFTGPDGGAVYPVGKRGKLRSNPRQHALVGGNFWGLQAVEAANPQLATEFADQFALTKKLTLENLRAAAALALTVPAEAQTGSSARVTVRVTNLTGHKLPTGYGDGRRVVVQLLVDGEVVTGGFDGGALLMDDQLRVYEARHGRAAIGVSEHLALHDAVVKDSRIPPTGMEPNRATDPVGVSWFSQSDGGFRDYDEATYTIPLSALLSNGAKAKVTARLLYQSTTPEYIEFLASENRTDDAGKRLLEIYNATGRGAPIEMAKTDGEISISRPANLDVRGAGRSCQCQSGFGLAGLAALWLLRLISRRKKPTAGF